MVEARAALLRLDAVWLWGPVREVALEAVQVHPGGAVADVAIGSDEVVRRLLHTQPCERLPVAVMKGAGRGISGRPHPE